MSELLRSNTLPAALVGGPPHSGKSVLIYSLSQALRVRGVEHYALRACPDGEGDWSNEAPPKWVRQIRIKGQWTPQWIERISRDIERRHLPLLVDVGGLPTPEQAEMFGRCTHAVLLTPDDASRARWRDLVGQHGLPLLADLHSSLQGQDRLDVQEPHVQGVLAGLERNSQAKGPAFEALVESLAQRFAADGAELRRRHLASAPFEIAVDLDRLARTLGAPFQGARPGWQPSDLPLLLDYLPAATPLAAFGRGSSWVHAALARLAHPARYASFDVRLGWVEAQRLAAGETPPAGPVSWQVQQFAGVMRFTATLPDHYIDISQLGEVAAPLAPAGVGVILSGRLPLWLFTSLAQTYAAASWLAVHQPALGGYVVVHSQDRRYPVGHLLAE